MKIEKFKIDQIEEVCRANKVKSLFAFGSVVRDDFNDNSDIDLVVDIDEKDPFKYSSFYFNLKTRLEGIFNRHVDLLEERALKNIIFKRELDNSKVKIYGY